MPTNTSRKERTTVSLSPYYREKVNKLVDNGKFSSASEIISISVQKFVDEYEREQKSKRVGMTVIEHE